MLSLAFRGLLRLFLPAPACAFLMMLLLQLGLFDHYPINHLSTGSNSLKKLVFSARELVSFPKQLSHWAAASIAMINPWDLERQYNPHITISGLYLQSYYPHVSYISLLSLFTVRLAVRVAAVSLGALVSQFTTDGK